jgi:hypothetical protein
MDVSQKKPRALTVILSSLNIKTTPKLLIVLMMESCILTETLDVAEILTVYLFVGLLFWISCYLLLFKECSLAIAYARSSTVTYCLEHGASPIFVGRYGTSNMPYILFGASFNENF